MSENAEFIALAFVRAINRQDPDALAALMSDEHRFIDSLGNCVVGRDAMRTAWGAYFRMVPDYAIVVDEILCDGPVVVLLGTAQGTYRDPQRAATPLQAANRWSIPAVLRAFIEDGKVAEWRVYADNEPVRKLMAANA